MNLINVVFNSKTQKNQLTSQKFHGISTQTPKCTSVVKRNNKFPNLFLPSTLVRHFLNVNVIFLGEEASNQPVGQTPTAKRQEKKRGALPPSLARCHGNLKPVGQSATSRRVGRSHLRRSSARFTCFSRDFQSEKNQTTNTCVSEHVECESVNFTVDYAFRS